jgi:hypothetical protein
VILTSGFRPDYSRWVRFPAFDEMGFPIQEHGASQTVPARTRPSWRGQWRQGPLSSLDLDQAQKNACPYRFDAAGMNALKAWLGCRETRAPSILGGWKVTPPESSRRQLAQGSDTWGPSSVKGRWGGLPMRGEGGGGPPPHIKTRGRASGT